MNERKLMILGLLLFSGLLFLELPGTHLFEPDEARYTQIPLEMLSRGDMVTPTLNSSHFFEKPPLLYWLNAASLKIFDESPFAARLSVRLALLATALMLIFFLGNKPRPNTGLWAALILLSSPLPFVLGRTVLTDGILSCTLTLTFFALKGFLNALDDGKPTFKWQALLGIGSALAFLSKGLIALAFPVGVLVIWSLLLGKPKHIAKVLFSWAFPVFFLIASPWFFLMEKANPGFLHFFFIHEHFQRFSTGQANRPGPFYYFILTFAWGFLPWIWFFDGALRPLLTHSGWKSRTDDLFYALWCFLIIGFFSISHSKLMPYILPAFPAAAALLARHFSPEFEADRRRWNIQIMMWLWMVPGLLAAGFLSGHIRHFGIQASATLLAISFLAGAFSRKFLRMALCWGVVQIALILAAPKLAKDYSDFGLAQIANTAHADKVVGFHCYPQSFPLVMKEPLTVVEFQGELASDGKMSPELFWDRDKFWTLWNSDKRVIACLRPEFLSLFERPGFKPGRQIGRNRRFILMANYK